MTEQEKRTTLEHYHQLVNALNEANQARVNSEFAATNALLDGFATTGALAVQARGASQDIEHRKTIEKIDEVIRYIVATPADEITDESIAAIKDTL